MEHHDSMMLSLSLAIMLATGLLLGHLMKYLHFPIIVGEFIGGIILGPTLLGRFAPDLFSEVFPSTGVAAVGRQTFIQLGLLCFLFSAGLEVNVSDLGRLGRKIVWTSSLGLVLPFVLGFTMVVIHPTVWDEYSKLDTSGLALFMGTALSISALPVIARILMDLDLLRLELGTIVLSAAALGDLIGWSLFAAILGAYSESSHIRHPLWLTLTLTFGLALFVLTLGRWYLQKTRRWFCEQVTWPGGLIGAAAVFWLLAAVVTEWIGVHAVLGAFLAGLALAQGDKNRDLPTDSSTEGIHQFAIGIFAPIYFVSLGLKTDYIKNFSLALAIVLLFIASVGKIGGVTIGGRLGGMRWREAFAAGFGMNARGAMEMILASIALENGLIGEKLFVALVFMALVTSVISGPMMCLLLRRGQKTAEI